MPLFKKCSPPSATISCNVSPLPSQTGALVRWVGTKTGIQGWHRGNTFRSRCQIWVRAWHPRSWNAFSSRSIQLRKKTKAPDRGFRWYMGLPNNRAVMSRLKARRAKAPQSKYTCRAQWTSHRTWQQRAIGAVGRFRNHPFGRRRFQGS